MPVRKKWLAPWWEELGRAEWQWPWSYKKPPQKRPYYISEYPYTPKPPTPWISPEQGIEQAKQATIAQKSPPLGAWDFSNPELVQEYQNRMAFNSPLRNIDWASLSKEQAQEKVNQLQDTWQGGQRQPVLERGVVPQNMPLGWQWSAQEGMAYPGWGDYYTRQQLMEALAEQEAREMGIMGASAFFPQPPGANVNVEQSGREGGAPWFGEWGGVYSSPEFTKIRKQYEAGEIEKHPRIYPQYLRYKNAMIEGFTGPEITSMTLPMSFKDWVAATPEAQALLRAEEEEARLEELTRREAEKTGVPRWQPARQRS